MLHRREFLRHSAFGLTASTIGGWPAMLGAQAGPSGYVIPLTMTDIRVAMNVTIGGQGPLLVALDTGGQLSLIDRDVADRLKLPNAGGLNLSVGGRLDRYGLRLARDVVFGGQLDRYSLRLARNVVFDGQFRQAEAVFAETEHVRFGEGVVASLAAGTLASFDSELDFNAMQLRVYPDGGPARSGWAASKGALEPARVAGLSPLLKADVRLGDRTVRAIVDTGAPRGVIVTDRLFQQLATGPNWSPAFKRGNRVERTARLSGALAIGGLVIDRPVVAAKDIGAFGAEAIIGLALLEQLNLATDVRRNILYMKPNGRPAPGPRYNMSGLWIDRDGQRIIAGAVGQGSPAERAGIKAGDELGGMPFTAMIAALNGPAGGTVALEVGPASARRQVQLTLADYL
jgi:serine protease Do